MDWDDPLIDLDQIVERFLGEAVSRQKEECQAKDDVVIDTLNDRGMSCVSRESIVRKWLNSYGVFQGLNKDDRTGVTNAIIEFADSRGPNLTPPYSEYDIIVQFNKLYEKCRSRVRTTKMEAFVISLHYVRNPFGFVIQMQFQFLIRMHYVLYGSSAG